MEERKYIILVCPYCRYTLSCLVFPTINDAKVPTHQITEYTYSETHVFSKGPNKSLTYTCPGSYEFLPLEKESKRELKNLTPLPEGVGSLFDNEG